MMVNCFRRNFFIYNCDDLDFRVQTLIKWVHLHFAGNYGEIINVELSMDRLVSLPFLLHFVNYKNILLCSLLRGSC
jgi:hypothetical protein